MSNQKETVKERLARLQREKEEAEAKAKAEAGENDPASLVSQLTHETDGEPDFAQLAEKLKSRKEEETPASTETVKFTIYIDKPVAEAFQALCVKRGDQRRFATEAFAEFVKRKVRELNID